MAPRNPDKLARKRAYFDKLQMLVSKYPQVMICVADHVGSKQMQEIRMSLRGKAVVLMGKNTMIRSALREFEEKNEGSDVRKLIQCVKGNIGFVFCKTDMEEIKQIVTSNRVPAAAKAGVIAPCDVTVPAGPTSMDPSKTAFFQALNIPTKVVKGQIEIVNDVHIIRHGVKVQLSEQVLLQALNIKPFAYGLEVTHIYDDGDVFPASALQVTDSVILKAFSKGVQNVAAFSRAAGIPTTASVPHSVATALKNMAALCSDIEFSFKEIQGFKDFLADPSKFAASATPSSGAEASSSAAAPAAAAAPQAEEEEEEADMDFALFD